MCAQTEAPGRNPHNQRVNMNTVFLMWVCVCVYMVCVHMVCVGRGCNVSVCIYIYMVCMCVAVVEQSNWRLVWSSSFHHCNMWQQTRHSCLMPNNLFPHIRMSEWNWVWIGHCDIEDVGKTQKNLQKITSQLMWIFCYIFIFWHSWLCQDPRFWIILQDSTERFSSGRSFDSHTASDIQVSTGKFLLVSCFMY